MRLNQERGRVDLRLRGPWLIRGILLDTSISSQSGTIGPSSVAILHMSPFTFFPGISYDRVLSRMVLRVTVDVFGAVDADDPHLELFNPPGVPTDYVAEWRHVNP